MVQHLLIAMFAPIFLVLGQPITLALRALPVKVARIGTLSLKSYVFRTLTHPVTALLLNTGGMFVLYLTPLYNRSLPSPTMHHLIHVHFLLAGFLFTWSMIGTDPVPHRPSYKMRAFVLFLSIGLHAFLSKFMYAYLFPRNSLYAEEEIRAAAKLMYYWGDLAELTVVILLFIGWYAKGRGLAQRSAVAKPHPGSA
jgi:putative membrane protein